MNIILKCVATACLLLFSLSAFGDNHRRSEVFVMFNAGTLNVGASIIDERSIGTLGRADVKIYTVVDVFTPFADKCPGGLVTTNDSVVLTFPDLSQLVGNAYTEVCIGEDGLQDIRGKGDWASGSRRFANVTGGKFRIRSTATPQSEFGPFFSTFGSISGRIKRN